MFGRDSVMRCFGMLGWIWEAFSGNRSPIQFMPRMKRHSWLGYRGSISPRWRGRGRSQRAGRAATGYSIEAGS